MSSLDRTLSPWLVMLCEKSLMNVSLYMLTLVPFYVNCCWKHVCWAMHFISLSFLCILDDYGALGCLELRSNIKNCNFCTSDPKKLAISKTISLIAKFPRTISLIAKFSLLAKFPDTSQSHFAISEILAKMAHQVSLLAGFGAMYAIRNHLFSAY